MIPIHEARTKLIRAGFQVQTQPIYKELTILDAKYDEVKSFLLEQGYDGSIVVIGKARKIKEQDGKFCVLEGEVEQLSTEAIKNDFGKRDIGKIKEDETTYEQLSFGI